MSAGVIAVSVIIILCTSTALAVLCIAVYDFLKSKFGKVQHEKEVPHPASCEHNWEMISSTQTGYSEFG